MTKTPTVISTANNISNFIVHPQIALITADTITTVATNARAGWMIKNIKNASTSFAFIVQLRNVLVNLV